MIAQRPFRYDAYTKLFFNWHAMASTGRPYLINLWSVWKPTVLLVMDDGATAAALKRKRPEATVVARFAPDEEIRDIDKKGGPEGWLEWAMSQTGNKDVVIQFGNEWGTSREHIDYIDRAVQYAASVGQAIGIGAWGTGGPSDSEFLFRILGPLKRWVEVLGDRLYWIEHDYFPNYTPQFRGERNENGVTRWVAYDPLYLIGSDPLDPSHGQAIDPDNILNYANWHTGRYARYIELARQNGLPFHKFPRVIIGELGPDDAWYSAFKGWRESRFGEPGLTEKQYAEFLIWLMRNVYHAAPNTLYGRYSTKVVGCCIFSFGNSGMGGHGQGDWYRFNVDNDEGYSRAADMFALLEKYAMEVKTVNVGDLVAATLDVVQAVRVRNAPDIYAGIIDTLQPGRYDMLVSQQTIEADGYEWIQHEAGWSAVRNLAGGSDFMTVTYHDNTTPPPSTGDADLDGILARLELLETSVTAFVRELNGHEAALRSISHDLHSVAGFTDMLADSIDSSIAEDQSDGA